MRSRTTVLIVIALLFATSASGATASCATGTKLPSGSYATSPMTAGAIIAAVFYITSEGRSEAALDPAEVKAIKKVFGDHASELAVSSTKSALGHLLGASGSVEAVLSILALNHNVTPPTLNLDHPDTGCDLNLVPHQSQEHSLTHVLSNSFGFGGTNVALVFSQLKT